MNISEARPEPESAPAVVQDPPQQKQEATSGTSSNVPDCTPADSESSVTAEKSKDGEGVSSGSSIEKPSPFKERTRDFWILPIPKRVRYHPDRPFVFSIAMNYLFAFVSCERPCSSLAMRSLTLTCRHRHLPLPTCRWSPIVSSNVHTG